MAAARHFILATAGHVDHGKSALITALTGTNPDRLPEEKARGITIDLGFARLLLPSPDGSSEFDVGVVDVPGHEHFIRNMVAGMGNGGGGVDAALLVVAADDGWMPQTQEHLEILTYLGIRHAVVALTKVDLASGERAIAQISQKLRGTPFAGAPVIAVSAKTGQQLPRLRQQLAAMLATLPARADIAKPRLAVDRVFTLKGLGTVVTGTLAGGSFARGQTVLIQPAGKTTRIRAIQSHNRDLDHALPGMRIALNLPDLAPHTDIARGQVVTLPGLASPSSAWIISLEHPSTVTLRDKTRVHVHHGTADYAATLDLLDAPPPALPPAPAQPPVRLARLRFDAPTFALLGDRFVLRDWSAQRTLAGGGILDIDPPARRWRSRLALYAERAQAPADAATWIRTQLQFTPAVPRIEMLRNSHFSEHQLAAALPALERAALLTSRGDTLLSAPWWQQVLATAARAIDAHHAARPQDRGLPLPQLQATLKPHLPEKFFPLLIADLLEQGFTTAANTVKRATHTQSLPPPLHLAGEAIRRQLRERPLEPPSRKELAADARSREALAYLLQCGEAVELSTDVILSAEALDAAARTIRDYLSAHGRATAAELKAALHSTRRIVIPLLEHFDKTGLTRRQGDLRTLGECRQETPPRT